jgi:D-3-phosphoglycerate dehydrogenase
LWLQESASGALDEAELQEKLRDVHVLGIRSKTQVTAAALKGARRLLAIGCFCIGTNQVDLQVRAKFAFNHLLYSRSC